MSSRTNINYTPSQKGFENGPWQKKARQATEMIAVLEKHFHPELDRESIAKRVIKHARVALGLEATFRLQNRVDVDAGRGRGAESMDLANAAGILRVVVEYAGVARDDERATENFMDVVQKTLRDLPEVSRYKTEVLKDSTNPLGKPFVQLVENPAFKRRRA